MPQAIYVPPPTTPAASKFQEVNGLVYEYLEVSGLQKALQAFSSECEAKSIPCPKQNSDSKTASFTRCDAEKLRKHFDDGNLEAFTKLWNIFLCHIQLSSDDDMKKLEVYIRVYFALWPRVRGQSESQQSQAMTALKIFFEQNSVALASDSAVLPLFALPFVGDPKAHPIFLDFLEPAWEQRLRSQLDQTLSKYFELLQENIENHSKLASIVLSSSAQQHQQPGGDFEVEKQRIDLNMGNLNAALHKERFMQLVATYQRVRKILRGTRDSYGKLMKVSNHLIIALEQAVSGEEATLEPVLQKCYEVFPELFTSDTTANDKPDKEYFKKLTSGAILDSCLDSDVSLFFVGISKMAPDCLDFTKIKSVLTSENVGMPDKLTLIQSLRWLLTRSSPVCRNQAMESFVKYDLLGLNPLTSPEYREKLFSCMLSPNPTYIKECFARILNSISSIYAGRSYLASTDYALKILVQSLHTFKGSKESFICQMVITTLQKLSLRKQMRLGMIEQKVIEWLVVYLKSELAKIETASQMVAESDELGNSCFPSYNPYFMEYGWALLMNLCLHEESNATTAGIAKEMLICIIQMLWTRPSPDVSPYIISTLYSLLRNPDIFALAKHMRLSDDFSQIVTNDNDTTELSSHLNHLISVLTKEGFDRVSTCGEVDYDDDESNDPDEFEPDIEVVETWAAGMDETAPTGDNLLLRHYMISTEDETVVPKAPPPLVHLTKEPEKQGVCLRPITPRKGTKSKNPSSISEGEIPVVRATVRPAGKKSKTTNRKKPSTVESAKKATSSRSATTNRGSGAGLLDLNFPGLRPNLKHRLQPKQPKIDFNAVARDISSIYSPTKSSESLIKSSSKTKNQNVSRASTVGAGTRANVSKSVESPIEIISKSSGSKETLQNSILHQKEWMEELLFNAAAVLRAKELAEATEVRKKKSRSATGFPPNGKRIHKAKGLATLK